MRHWVRVSRIASILLLLQAILFSGSVYAQSEIKVVDPSNSPEISELLVQGSELERQRRWADALILYQNALRKNRSDLELQQRVQVARIHYDLARRYSDNSFRKELLGLGEQQALELYDMALSRIQSHYVQMPNWKYLFDRGTYAFEVAVRDPEFLKSHLPEITTEQLTALILEFRQVTASYSTIQTRYEAQSAVAHLGQLVQSRVGLPPSALIMEYLCAASGGLDEYSTFLTKDQLTDIYSQIEGNFVGLGVELKADEGALLIVNTIANSPARKAGLNSGDRITSIDGLPTSNYSMDEAANMLQGEAGSSVTVEVVAADQATRTLTIRRDHVEVPSIDHVKILEPESGIAYLKLTCFQKTTSRDLDAALWQLQRQGMRSLIIDLRGNPGGLLSSSVEIVDKFVDHGVIVSTRGRDRREDFTYTAQPTATWRVPLVVLIDGDSASASEIFAGAIRDHRRGTIVGTRSYGKGSVQGIFPLGSFGTGLRLTTAKFLSPTNQEYANIGVQPEVEVRQVAKPVDGQIVELEADSEKDIMLSAALQAARRTLASR